MAINTTLSKKTSKNLILEPRVSVTVHNAVNKGRWKWKGKQCCPPVNIFVPVISLLIAEL
jgi:hypothetical protein